MSALPASLKAKLEADIAREDNSVAEEASRLEAAENERLEAERNKVDDPPETEKHEPAKVVTLDNGAAYDRLEARLEAMQTSLARLEAENARLKEAAEKKPDPAPVIDIELTEDERKAYTQSIPIIEKIANRVAKPLLEEIKVLREKMNSAETSYANMSEGMFVSTLHEKIPELRKKISSPKWKAYVDSKIPRTSLTVGMALKAAHDERNLDSIKEIFNDFALSENELGKQAIPASSKAAERPTQEKQLKFSDRKKISADFLKGRIPKERFDELVAAYELAEKEGRVNFDT